MPRHRRWFVAILAAFGLALAVIGSVARPAGAQQAPPSPPASGLQVIVTPLLWLGGTNATIQTPLRRAPTVDASVGAFQTLGHLDGIPFMGLVEISDGPFSILGDTIHLPVGASITTRNVFFNGGSAALNVNQGTADFLYHLLVQPRQSLDVGIGFRAWDFYSNLTLNGRIARTVSITRVAQWADPLVAIRYHYDFGNRFGLTAYGDLGGFGVGAHTDWQVLGTIDYALKPWVALRLGYASLNFNYTAPDGLGFISHMKGPLLAASFRF